MKRLPLVASFVLFVALCASLTFWAMQVFKPVQRAAAPPPQAPRAEVRVDIMATLFGGRATAVAVASNYQLKGVVMAGTPGESIAILSADGKPAQATRVNKEVQPGVVVKEVHPTYVLLSEGGMSKRVELPDSAKNQLSIGGAAPAMPPGMPTPLSAEPAPLNAPPPPPPHVQMANPGINPMAPSFPSTPPVMQQGTPDGQPLSPQQNNGVIAVPAPAQR